MFTVCGLAITAGAQQGPPARPFRLAGNDAAFWLLMVTKRSYPGWERDSASPKGRRGTRHMDSFLTSTEAMLKMRGKTGSLILGYAAYFLLAGGMAFASGHPAAASVKRGNELFQQKCVGCHNKRPGDTGPFGPPNLHGILRQKLLTPEQACNIVRHGKGSMPAFGTLSDSQIEELLAYLKTQ